MPRKIIDITGKKFGWLTAISCVSVTPKGANWKVKCRCGNIKVVRGAALRSGVIKACGCRQKTARVTHGMRYSRLYNIWCRMIQRCRSKNGHHFKFYVEQGITVCKRWLKFDNFNKDMGPSYKDGLTLDRLKGSKGYNKSNCVWSNRKQQARNTKRNRIINTPQGKMLLCEAVDISGIRSSTLAARVDRGWPVKNLFDKIGKKGSFRRGYP